MENMLKELRQQKGLSQKRVAEAVGMSQQNYFQYEKGTYDLREINARTLLKFAEFYNVPTEYLLGEINEQGFFKRDTDIFTKLRPVVRRRLPILGQIACGKPIVAEANADFYGDIETEIKADYVYIASGDSMSGARIEDGDLIFIRVQERLENGEIGAIAIDGEITLKRFYYLPEKNRIILKAENPNYEPLVYIGDECEQMRIIGKAVAFQSSIRKAGVNG
jgi:repressor LexA